MNRREFISTVAGAAVVASAVPKFAFGIGNIGVPNGHLAVSSGALSIADIEAAYRAIKENYGRTPNVLVLGQKVYEYLESDLQRHPLLSRLECIRD